MSAAAIGPFASTVAFGVVVQLASNPLNASALATPANANARLFISGCKAIPL
jgi:hypothetical protein